MKRRTFLTSTVSAGMLTGLGCNTSPSSLPSSAPSADSQANEIRGDQGGHELAGRERQNGQKEPEPAPEVSPGSAADSPESADSPEPTKLAKIYLQPLGSSFSQLDTDFIVQALGVYFPHPVSALPSAELPQSAYYPPRSRYRAEKLIEFLAERTPGDAQVLVGLTAVDISTKKGSYEDWGILGLAMVGGRQCVISRFRAARGAKDDKHTRIRLAKTVIHEVGHTLGLDHCPNYGCIMEDGKGSVLTTDHEYDICPHCRERVPGQILAREVGAIPWPNPKNHGEN